MQPIVSQFKYTIELGLDATKTAFKLKKSSKEKTTHILLIVFTVIMAGMLVWDIVRDASFTIDLILLVALVGAEIFNVVMPKLILHTQKKFLNKINLNEFDYTITEITKKNCSESYYKNNKVAMQNVCDMSKLVAYEVKDKYVFVVFNNFACAVFDLTTLNISLDEFKQHLDKVIASNKANKTIKR